MAKRGFLERHRIVRNAIREDVLYFALPALLLFSAGLVASARDGWDGIVATIWNLVTQPRNLRNLSAQNIVGLALILTGFTILFVAVGTLRRFYSSTLVIREDHQLITHGIYRFVRHPIYLGVIMVFIGVPVYASSLYGLLIMSTLVLVILNRISIEERMLTEEFGDDYRSYKDSTSKLIPFIY